MRKYIVNVENIITGEKTVKTIGHNQLDDNILDAFGVSAESDFMDVYLTDRNYMVYEKIPYVLVDGKIKWDVPFVGITVRQFVDTYNIVDGRINVKTGFPAASGADLITFKEMWEIFFNNVLPALVDICGIISAYGVLEQKFIKIRNKAEKVQKKEIAPDFVTDAIYRKNMWNHFEFSIEFDITEDESKELLKGLGYSWDNSKKLYIISEDEKDRRITIIKKQLQELKVKGGYSR